MGRSRGIAAELFANPTKVNPELRTRAVRGGATTLASRLVIRFFSIGITAVLARLLTPADFGLIAVFSALFGLGNLAQEMGLSAATVQRREITEQQVSTLYWINVGMGTLLSGVAMVLAPWIAAFVERPDAVMVAVAMSSSFFLSSLGVQHTALLQRAQRFSLQARVGVTATVVSGASAVILAILGARVWALVALLLVDVLVRAVLVRQASGFRPGRPRFDRDVLSMTKFGGGYFAYRALGFMSHKLQVVLLGKYVDTSSAGLFSRAYSTKEQLLGLANTPAAKVVTATLPRLVGDLPRFRNFYLRSLSVQMIAAAPMAAFIGVFAHDVVLLLLGNQWTQSAKLLQIFSIGMLMHPIMFSTGWIYLAFGNMRALLRWGVFGYSVMIAASILGLQWGIEGVAWAWVAGSGVLMIPATLLAYRQPKISVVQVYLQSLKPVCAALLALGPAVWISQQLAQQSLFLRLPVEGAVFGLGYAALVWWVFGQKELVQDVLQALRNRKTAG